MWKYVIALLIPVAAFAGGYYYGSGHVVEKVVTEKGETVTVIKDRIITVIKETKPDGTVVETTKEEEINHNTTETNTLVDKSKGAQSQYRLGAQYWVSGIRELSSFHTDAVSISGSRRIIGPFWGDVQVRPMGDHRELAVGLSIEL